MATVNLGVILAGAFLVSWSDLLCCMSKVLCFASEVEGEVTRSTAVKSAPAG